MYEWDSLEGDLALKVVNERDPSLFPFGYYAYETCSTNSRGYFRWFASEKELLAFITLKDSGSESDECCCDEPHDFFESYQRLKATIAHANIRQHHSFARINGKCKFMRNWVEDCLVGNVS